MQNAQNINNYGHGQLLQETCNAGMRPCHPWRTPHEIEGPPAQYMSP